LEDNAIVIADRDGVIRFWSVGAEKAFGHAAAQAVGRTLDLIVPADYRQAHWVGFRRAVQSGSAAAEGQVTPFPVLHANGDVEPAPARLTLVREGQGRVIAAMVVFN